MVKLVDKHLVLFKRKLPTRRKLTSTMSSNDVMFINSQQNINNIPSTSNNQHEVGEFQEFQKPRKVAKTSNKQSNDQYSLNLTNRYSHLTDHDYCNSSEMEHLPTNSSDPTNTSKKTKIPPIFVYHVNNYQKLVDDIKSVTKSNFLTENKGIKIKIMLEDADDFKTLTSFFDTNGVQYHSYKLNSETEISVVIRNLPLSVTETEIKHELEALDFPVKKVVRLINKMKNPIPICIIDLVNDNKAKEIFSLEKLFHLIVTVEPRRKPKDIPQCSRCQRFGHTKNFCKLSPRCVKCPGNHFYSECKKPSSEAPICVNCSGNHSANYRGCTYFKNIQPKVNSSKSIGTNDNSHTDNTSKTHDDNLKTSKLNPNKSYSSVLKGTSKGTTPTSSSNENVSQAETTTADDDSKFISILLDLIKPFIPKIKTFVMQLFKNIFDHGSSN